MLQTDNYNLNLIEKTDTFSPDPLNDNAQKLDAVLSAGFTALGGASADLEQRVTTLESHKIAIGQYKGTGTTQTFDLGFTPLAVHIATTAYSGATLAIRGRSAHGVTLLDNGFSVAVSEQGVNRENYIYLYCAIS